MQGANCSSGAVQHFISKALMVILSSHIHTHTYSTAVGSNLVFSILPEETLTGLGDRGKSKSLISEAV